MNYQDLKSFIKDMARFPILTREQETELSAEIQGGNLEARNRMVECNLRLAVYFAKRRANETGEELGDVLENAVIGLLRAAELYDPSYDTKFSTYAFYWMKQTTRAHRDGGAIYLPAYIKDLMVEIRKKGLANSSVDEVSSRCNVKRKKAGIALKAMTLRRVYQKLTREDEPDWVPLTYDVDRLEQEEETAERSSKIAEALSVLDERSRYIVKRRIWDGRSLTIVGKEIGLTKEAVRLIQDKALGRIAEVLDPTSPCRKMKPYQRRMLTAARRPA